MLGRPAITHTSLYYAKLDEALTADVKLDFPNCLVKQISTYIKWQYFCWGPRGRRGSRELPQVHSLSLHSAEPEQVQLDLEELQVRVTPNLAEAGALLEFESKAYSGMDDLPASFSLGGYSFDMTTFLLALLAVISMAGDLIAFFFLFSLRLTVKKLNDKLVQTQKDLGMTDTNTSAT